MNGDADVENKLVDTEGEGYGGQIEKLTFMYILLSWVKQIASRKLLYNTGSLAWLSVTVVDFIFWGSKIIADGDCSYEIKRRLLPGRKVMTNLDSILKSRDITLSTEVRLVKAMVFPVVMYGCESWAYKES